MYVAPAIIVLIFEATVAQWRRYWAQFLNDLPSLSEGSSPSYSSSGVPSTNTIQRQQHHSVLQF